MTLIVQDILWLATTSVDGGVKIWDANTGEQIQSLGGHQSGVRHACFSSDGCTLLTAARDCTAKIWNTLTGEPVEIFKGHTNAVYTAVFSEDGYLVLTASYDGTARLWYVLTGECIKTFSGHNDGVVSAIFAHDGLSILTASVDRSAKIWDLQTAECVQTLTRPRGEATRAIGGRFWGGPPSPCYGGGWDVEKNHPRGSQRWFRSYLLSWVVRSTLVGPLVEVNRQVIVSVFSTPVQNWALSTLQEGTAKLWNIKTQQLGGIFQANQGCPLFLPHLVSPGESVSWGKILPSMGRRSLKILLHPSFIQGNACTPSRVTTPTSPQPPCHPMPIGS